MNSLLLALVCGAGLVVLRLASIRRRAYLRDIPGPFVASFSNIWKFASVHRHEIHKDSIKAHERYGLVVRIGPNHVSCASPEAMQIIHGSRDAFPKSNFYKVTSPVYQDAPLYHLFSAQDLQYHADLKKNVAGLYTKASVQIFEAQVDDCVRLLVDQMSARSGSDSDALDMSLWLHLYAFDSLCAINVSKTFGFLKAGQDVGGLIARGDYVMYLFGLYSQSPFLQRMNAWLKWLKGLDKKNPLLAYTVANMQEREGKAGGKTDMLNSFLALHDKQPNKVSLRETTGAIYINLMAGHDVLATTVRAIFYYLARYPETKAKLRAEIQSLAADFGDEQLLPYKDLAKLPYLDAVVYEALRIHANTGMILERVVPAGGTTIDGFFLPAGTIVGCNAWVLHRNVEIYGEDVDVFKPERWLEASEQHLAIMKRNIFSFGAGPRLCIGRNVAWLQMLKVVAEFYRRYDATLASPDKEWKVDGSWVTTQTEMDMLVRPLAGLAKEDKSTPNVAELA